MKLEYWNAIKEVFKYIKGTLDYGLEFGKFTGSVCITSYILIRILQKIMRICILFLLISLLYVEIAYPQSQNYSLMQLFQPLNLST